MLTYCIRCISRPMTERIAIINNYISTWSINGKRISMKRSCTITKHSTSTRWSNKLTISSYYMYARSLYSNLTSRTSNSYTLTQCSYSTRKCESISNRSSPTSLTCTWILVTRNWISCATSTFAWLSLSTKLNFTGSMYQNSFASTIKSTEYQVTKINSSTDLSCLGKRLILCRGITSSLDGRRHYGEFSRRFEKWAQVYDSDHVFGLSQTRVAEVSLTEHTVRRWTAQKLLVLMSTDLWTNRFADLGQELIEVRVQQILQKRGELE